MFRTSPLALLLFALPLPAQEPKPGQEYLAFIKKQAADLRANDKPPATADEWKAQRDKLRANLLAAWGGFPAQPCPLEPKLLGTLNRDGYRVEKLIFQTRPGVWMTANAYVPDRKGKLPAILMVHGHWAGAKQDPVVQSRCIGAARLGFFVLCVDAFGAGERGVGTALGEYHGDMTAATLLPVGRPLSGLQVYENMRAVDYLGTRPEVDADRIGITGASGGGNQTMYAGAMDDRLKCVVPVCSVGNYQAYLGAACCMCEVVPGALTFTEEWGLLAMVAPRGLMVVSATKDAFQFSVGEAKKSLALAEPVFKLLGKPGNVRHAVFESPHAYNREMREAMYGWMTLHLKGEGDGGPIREPEFKTENPEDLRCFPGDTRPKDFVTIPRFATADGRKVLAEKPEPTDAEGWKVDAERRRKVLVEKSLGGFPNVKAQQTSPLDGDQRGVSCGIRTEPGVELNLTVRGNWMAPQPKRPTLVVILTFESGQPANTAQLAKAAQDVGWVTLSMNLRATDWKSDSVNRAPDHNTAEWGLWIGRPLLGQWVFDVRQVLTALESTVAKDKDIVLLGEGPAGLVALCAATTDPRITKVAAVGTLASYLTDGPYVGQRLGTLAPGIVRDVGDVPHLAALALPRRVVIAGGVGGNGKPLTGDQLREAYRPASRVAGLLESEKELVILDTTDAAGVVAALK